MPESIWSEVRALRGGTPRRCLALLSAIAAAACAGDAEPLVVTRTDSMDVSIVSNDGPDRPLELTATLAYRLGGDEDGPASFYQLSTNALSIGRDGRLAVVDRPGHTLSVFDADGRPLFSAGGEGGGPGEFELPTSIVTLWDGSVAVFDFQKQAMVRFGPEGALIDESPLGVPYTGLGMTATEGGLLVVSQTRARRTGILSRRVLHLAASDTVQLGAMVTSASRMVEYPSCGVVMNRPPLFEANLVWASNGVRTAVATDASYSVTVFDAIEPQWIVRRPIEPEPVTDAVLEREVGEGRTWMIDGRECLVPRAEVVEQRGHASQVPVIESLAVDPDGRIWVRRRVAGSASRLADVIDADGEYLGTLPDDFPFPLQFFPDGRFATIDEDEFEVERVAVWEIPAALAAR